jgi:hypothetical protein
MVQEHTGKRTTRYLSSRDTNWNSFAALLCCLPREIDNPGAHVSMQIALKWLVDTSAGVFKRSHLPNHGKNGWKWLSGIGREGDMDDRSGINDSVDYTEVVGSYQYKSCQRLGYLVVSGTEVVENLGGYSEQRCRAVSLGRLGFPAS